MCLSEYNTRTLCSNCGVFCAWKGLTSRVLKGHTSYVFCINYNTEGTQLVSGGCEGDVRIWNAAKGACNLLSRDLTVTLCAGRCTKTLNAHLDYVTAVHSNRDGSLIVSCALDGLMCAPTYIHITFHFIIQLFPSQPHMEFTIRTMPQDPSGRTRCHVVRE